MQILGPLSIFTFIPNPVLAIGPFLRLLLQPCYMKKIVGIFGHPNVQLDQHPKIVILLCSHNQIMC